MNTSPANTWDAHLYQDKHAFVWEFGKELLGLLQPKPKERILDIGCGTGQLAQQIAGTGAEVIGIDRSPEMIDQAKANFPSIQFTVADATNFQFDQPFDAIFSNAALHWVKPPEAAVACIARALRPGGRFVAEFGGRGNIRAIMQAVAQAAKQIDEPQAAEINPWYYPSIGEYASLLETNGIEVTFATLFDRPTPLSGDDAIENWLKMFWGSMLAAIPPEKYQRMIQRIEENARPHLFRDGKWIADYRRLRIVAEKRA